MCLHQYDPSCKTAGTCGCANDNNSMSLSLPPPQQEASSNSTAVATLVLVDLDDLASHEQHVHATDIHVKTYYENTHHYENEFETQSDNDAKVQQQQQQQQQQEEDEEETFAQGRKETDQLLRTLASHLDLLAAGSLFLLPSVIPYLASALSSYTINTAFTSPSPASLSTSAAKTSTDANNDNSNWNLETAWILLLPSIGVMIPLLLFKIMCLLEEKSFRCPFQRWRRNRGTEGAVTTTSGNKRRGRNAKGKKRSQEEEDEQEGNDVSDRRTSSDACAVCCHAAPASASPPAFASATRGNTIASPTTKRWRIMSCPSVCAIRRTLRVLRGDPPGYGPLALDTSPLSRNQSRSQSQSQSPSSNGSTSAQWSLFLDGASDVDSNADFEQERDDEATTPLCCSCKHDGNEQKISVPQLSVLPRPRSILLASLGAWTVLMAFSSVLGFNTIVVTPAVSSTNSTPSQFLKDNTDKPPAASVPGPVQDSAEIDLRVWEPQPARLLRQGGFVMAEDVEDENDDNMDVGAAVGGDLMKAVVDMLEQDLLLAEAADEGLRRMGVHYKDGDRKLYQTVWLTKRVGDQVDEDEKAHKKDNSARDESSDEERIQAYKSNLNKRELVHSLAPASVNEVKVTAHQKKVALDDSDEDDQDVEDFLEPDSLDALVMDSKDASVFHDFLVKLEREDQAAQAVEQTREQVQLQKQKQLIKDTNDLVVDSMLKHDIPCGSGSGAGAVPGFNGGPMGLTPTWIIGLPGIAQKIYESAASGSERMFSANSNRTRRERGQVFKYLSGWTELMILAVTMSLGGLLVGLAQAKSLYYQFLAEYEAQALPFAEGETRKRRASMVTVVSCLMLSGSALGLALLMMISECWDVPSVYFVGIGIAGMILVHTWVPDMALQIESSVENGEDKVEGDEQESDCEEKGEWPAATAMERRNACSLDESRRWEVTSRCLEASCFTR